MENDYLQQFKDYFEQSHKMMILYVLNKAKLSFNSDCLSIECKDPEDYTRFCSKPMMQILGDVAEFTFEKPVRVELFMRKGAEVAK